MPKDPRLKTGPAADPRPVRRGAVGRGRRTPPRLVQRRDPACPPKAWRRRAIPPYIQFFAAGLPRSFETAPDTGGAAFPRSAFRVQLFRLSLLCLTVPLWQGKIEGRALSGLALNPDPPAMELDDMFHDAQAKAGAAFLAGAPLVDPIKPLEDMGKVRGGYAWPVVPDAHFGLPLLEPRIYFDPRSTRGVLEGVIEKVVADLGDFERIEEHEPDRRIDRQRNLMLARGGTPAEIFDQAAQKIRQRRGFPVQSGVDRLQPRKRQQIFEQRVEPVGMPLDRVQKTVAIVERHVAMAVHQGFDVTFDDAERSTQFVGDIGDKILPDGFQPLLLGDVVEDK